MTINAGARTVALQTTVHRAFADQLREIADANDRSVATEMRRALRQYIAAQNEDEPAGQGELVKKARASAHVSQ